MKSTILFLTFFLTTNFAFASGKKSCGEHNKISCEGIENAKRTHFCWKKKDIAPEKRIKYCQKSRKAKSK